MFSKREVEDFRPKVDRIVEKFLGFHEPALVETALHCLCSGYDRKKTSEKLASLLDSGKADRLAEKVLSVVEITRDRSSRKRHYESTDSTEVKKSKPAEEKKADLSASEGDCNEYISPVTTSHLDDSTESNCRCRISCRSLNSVERGTDSIVKEASSLDKTNVLLDLISKKFPGEPDQFDIVGKNVAAKLRSLRDEQRIFAEKLIHDVLFEAELGSLNRNWKLLFSPLVDSTSNSHAHVKRENQSPDTVGIISYESINNRAIPTYLSYNPEFHG